MSPFTEMVEVRKPISRVRVVKNPSKFGANFSCWLVEYLPAGCSNWWWNWQVASRFVDEEDARDFADVLAQRRYVSETKYRSSEVQL